MHMVYRAKNQVDAKIAADMLADNGIDAHISSSTGLEGPLAQPVIQVSVDNRRLDAARRVIAAWRGVPGAPQPTRTPAT